MNSEMELTIEHRATSWLKEPFDAETRAEVQRMMDEDPKELEDCFYTDLEFGTGGLRGVMGVGTNRINRYTIGMATQGLANYLLEAFPNEPVSVAIAFDSRINSPVFAQTTADVLSANGIKVYLFPELRPTPQLSFAIRHLGCRSGIVITASHNPKEYNGYKVYWEDGAQIINPHDKNIIKHVRAIQGPHQVKFTANENLIEILDEKVDEAYREMILSMSLSPEAILLAHDLSIVYTGLHGTGITHIPETLKRMGFTNVHVLEDQSVPDGRFPSVLSPNPEEKVAMMAALDKGVDVDAELIMGTDPDADRVGIAVRNYHGKIELLNGNQAACLLVYYLLVKGLETGGLSNNPFICKTIVTTDLIDNICKDFNVTCFNTLTGFKYIASIIREQEGKMTFIGGGEESYGYLIGDQVRDKDAVASAAFFAEMAAWAKSIHTSLFSLLMEIYTRYGFYRESLWSLVKKGKQGGEEITRMMNDFRNNPPREIAGIPVVRIADYLSGTITEISHEKTSPTGLPASNVLQFFLADGSKVTARPSGTEPKIKFYVSVKGSLTHPDQYLAEDKKLQDKSEAILQDLGVLE